MADCTPSTSLHEGVPVTSNRAPSSLRVTELVGPPTYFSLHMLAEMNPCGSCRQCTVSNTNCYTCEAALMVRNNCTESAEPDWP